METSNTTSVPPNYLATPQLGGGIGMGHFLDASEMSTTTSNSGYGGYPEHMRDNTQGTVDDFGVGLNSNPNNNSSGEGPGGGRFATFPVKGRGLALRDDGPGRSGAHEAEQSFSSGVANAMRGYDQPQPRKSQEAPAYTPLQGPPPGAAPPAEISGAAGWPAPPEDDLGEDARLAYMAFDGQDSHDHDNNDEGGSRHVRFGGVNDVDKEMEQRVAHANESHRKLSPFLVAYASRLMPCRKQRKGFPHTCPPRKRNTP